MFSRFVKEYFKKRNARKTVVQMSPSNHSSPVKNLDSVRDAHEAFVKSSKQLISTTRRKIDFINGLSDEIRYLASQIKDDRIDKAQDQKTEMLQDEQQKNEHGVENEPSGHRKVNTKIRIVVPVCSNLPESASKSPRRKSQKKSASKGKKVSDNDIESLANRYCKLKVKKVKHLDPIKYLKLTEEERLDRLEIDKEKQTKKKPVSDTHGALTDTESNDGDSVTIDTDSRHRVSSGTPEYIKSKDISLPKVGTEISETKTDKKEELFLPSVDDKMDTRTFCTINASPDTVTCENCRAKALRERQTERSLLKFDNIPKSLEDEDLSGQTVIDKHINVYNQRRAGNNAIQNLGQNRAVSSRGTVHFEMNQRNHNEISKFQRSKTCRIRRHETKPDITRQSFYHKAESAMYNHHQFGQVGFRPEVCPKLSIFCTDDLERRHASDCFSNRKILRPNKVTLQSSTFPDVFSESSFLPIEEISIGFRFRLGKKPALPFVFEPGYKNKATVRSMDSCVFRSFPKPKTASSHGHFRI